jgi:hypothetical protein
MTIMNDIRIATKSTEQCGRTEKKRCTSPMFLLMSLTTVADSDKSLFTLNDDVVKGTRSPIMINTMASACLQQQQCEPHN